MGAAFNDLAAINDQDLVGCMDSAQPMSDHNTGAVDHDVFERFLDQGFGFAVKMAGCFIQYEDGGAQKSFRAPHREPGGGR